MAAPWRLMWEGPAPPSKATRWRGRLGRRPAQLEAAQELGADRPPAGGVVDEQARAARGSAGQHHPVAVQVQLVTGQPADPVQQLVTAQAWVTDQLVEVLHEQGLVEHGQALRAGPGRRRGRRSRRAAGGRTASGWRRGAPRSPGAAADGGRAGRVAPARGWSGSGPAAGPRPRRPGAAGDSEPVLFIGSSDPAVWPLLLAEGWVASRTASSSSHPMRRASAPSTVCGWVSRSRPSPISIAFQASATWLAVTSLGRASPRSSASCRTASASGSRKRAWMAAKRSRSSGWRTTCAQNSKNTASQPSSRSRR